MYVIEHHFGPRRGNPCAEAGTVGKQKREKLRGYFE